MIVRKTATKSETNYENRDFYFLKKYDSYLYKAKRKLYENNLIIVNKY